VAEHGYVVVAYSLDGAIRYPESNRAIQGGIRGVPPRTPGLDNARRALRSPSRASPRADPERVYAVWPQLGATWRSRGIEYRRSRRSSLHPITDVEARVDGFRRELRDIDRAAMAILRDSSPMAHVADLRASRCSCSTRSPTRRCRWRSRRASPRP